MTQQAAKRVSKPRARSTPPTGAMAYQLLEAIVRRSRGWADGIVSPFALRRPARTVRVRRRAN